MKTTFTPQKCILKNVCSVQPLNGQLLEDYSSTEGVFRPWSDSDRTEYPQAERQIDHETGLVVNVETGQVFMIETR
jgi:hypothetical protein